MRPDGAGALYSERKAGSAPHRYKRAHFPCRPVQFRPRIFLKGDNMLKYLNGKILNSAIPNETTLVIKTAGENIEQGKPLTSAFETILKEYAKHVTTICFIGGENETVELLSLLKEIRKRNLKTGLSTHINDMSKINNKLLDELTYLQLDKKMFIKDFCPFTDEEDWFEITNQNM